MTRNEVLGAMHGSLAFLGAAANLALLAGFAWGAMKLYGISSGAFAAAGGMPDISVSGAQGMVLNPALPTKATDYATAWFAAVGAGGCAIMTALGLRWAYHGLSRILLGLKD
jgi:hypothetical protein